jgi:hypothetical protein
MSLNCNSNNNNSNSGNNCNSQSAKALRCIIDLVDDLNRNDLCLLSELIDRILCTKSC